MIEMTVAKDRGIDPRRINAKQRNIVDQHFACVAKIDHNSSGLGTERGLGVDRQAEFAE